MDPTSIPAPPTTAPTTDELRAHVRGVLAESYAHPVVVARPDGKVAVLAGNALEHARAAAETQFGPHAAARVDVLDTAALPWRAVPAAGLRLWRQHGRAGVDGEVVTELEFGDPPLQVVTEESAWALVRLFDGAQGWVRAAELDDAEPAIAPATDLADATRIDTERFVEEVLRFEGTRYVWGGTTADGVDCSGIVQRAAWRAGGCWLPRHSKALLTAGTRVAPSQVARGDVLVLRRDPGTIDAERRAQLAALAQEEARTGVVPAHGPAVHPLHVAVALSPDEVIHASRDAMRVERESLAAIRARYRVLGVRRLGSRAHDGGTIA